MRLWSIHPRYLDVPGLLGVWREGLLAQAVLAGRTRGYLHHPQFARFRQAQDPLAGIAEYLRAVAAEARRRGYRFAEAKIGPASSPAQIPVTRGQVEYEWRRLLSKLEQRDPARWEVQRSIPDPEVHPLFFVVEGEIEPWEVVRTGSLAPLPAPREARPPGDGPGRDRC